MPATIEVYQIALDGLPGVAALDRAAAASAHLREGGAVGEEAPQAVEMAVDARLDGETAVLAAGRARRAPAGR